MQCINSFTISICAVAVLSFIFEILTPNGNMKKIMQFVIAIFVIFSISLPILSGVSKFNFNFLNVNEGEDYKDISSNVNDLYIKTSQSKISKLIDKTLKENQITAENIETNMDINEDGSIDINRIIIYLKKQDEDKALKVKNIIKQELNLNCEIEISGE